MSEIKLREDYRPRFLSSWDSSFLYFLVWRKSENGDRFEKENGSRVTVAYLSPPFRSSQTAYCYTCVFISAENYACRPTPASSLLTYGISSPFAKLSIYVSRHPSCAFVHFV